MSNAEQEQQRQFLLFRQFALQELSVPAIGVSDPQGTGSGDFLQLSLLSFNQHLELTKSLRRSSGEPFAVQAAYLDDNRMNARAALRKGVHLIGMHIGLAVSAYEFSLFCLSQSSVLKDIGNPVNERNPGVIDGFPPGFWMRGDGAIAESDAFLAATGQFLPVDPDRAVAAIMVTMLMLRFVWFHELYHCTNGHVGYVEGYGQLLGLSENDSSQTAEVAPEILQLLELDADQSALNTLFDLELAGLENIEGLLSLPRDTRFSLCLFAAYAATWLLEEHQRRSAEVSACHPEPSIRRQNLIRTFASVIFPKIDGARAIHDKALFELDTINEIVPSFPSASQLRHEMTDDALQASLDDAQRRLPQLREQLTPFLYV